MKGLEADQDGQAPVPQSLVARLAARPLKAVLLLSAVQLVAWTVLPYLASSAPPLDVVEGLIWGKEWLLGTHKHPTLQAWLIELSYHATGSPIFGPYLLSQLSVGLTYLFAFLTGSLLTTRRNALIGTLLLTPIVYFTWLTPEFNPNVLQLPIWSAAILLYTLVRQQPERALPWLSLGAVVGLGILAKYSVLVLYILLAIWTLAEREMRWALRRPWPWLAIGLALLIASPHLVWLVQNHFPTLRYAESRGGSGGSPLLPLHWLAAQAADHLPLVIFFLLVGYRSVLALPRTAGTDPQRRYIIFLALGPAVLTVALSTVTGIGLRDMWGMPMFTLSGLLIVCLLDRQWSSDLSARALVVATAFIVAPAFLYSGAVALSPTFDAPKRNAWPMREIAGEAEAAWARRTDAPLKIVSGNSWLAGLVAAGSPSRPSVVYDGELSLSPWLSEEQLTKDGVFYIWAGKEAPGGLLPKEAELDLGSFSVTGTKIPSGIIGYAIQLPKP